MPSSSSQRQTEADRSRSYASEQQRLASSSDAASSSSSSSSEEDDAELYAVVQQAMLAFERPSSKRRPQQLPPSQLQSAPLHQQSRANAPTSPSPVNPDQPPAQQPAQRQAPPQDAAVSRPASARQHRDPTAAAVACSQHTSQQTFEGSDDPFARGGFLTHEELARRRAARLQRAEMEAHRDLTYQPRIYKSRVRADLVIPRPSKILPASSSATAAVAPHGDEPRRESPRGPAWAKRLYHRDFSDRRRRAENYEQLRLDAKQREELLSEMHCTFAPTTTVPPSWCARSKRTAEDACAALYRQAHRQQQQQEAAAAEKDGTAAPSNAGNGQVAVRMNEVQRRLFNDAIRRQGGRLEALQEAKKARHRSSSRHWSPPSARPTDSHYYVMTDD